MNFVIYAVIYTRRHTIYNYLFENNYRICTNIRLHWENANLRQGKSKSGSGLLSQTFKILYKGTFVITYW